jgi:pyrimidine deaminase RibD-like protein
VPFDRDKLARSIRIALRKRPVEEERVERIVNGIVRQLESSGESDIPSKQIGELVMEALKELDKVAYVRFASSIAISARRRISRSSMPRPRRWRRAGDAARGATAYVTLEPCSHHGQTPPCADALIAGRRGPRRGRDRGSRSARQRRGLARLRAAGIAVETGCWPRKRARLNRVPRTRRSGRPLVTLKLAATLDGRIATHTGESQWITGEPARRLAICCAAEHDAVMVGSGTVLADDPA